MNLQITAPIGGTFDVVIKNSGGTTVYSATHGNEVFDPAITTAGDYEMYIDGADTPVYCFTITACECPPFLQAFISTPNDVFYYFNIEFDLSGWTFCPFFIYVESIGYFSATYAINTLADLTFVSSDLGRKTTLIGGRTDIYYAVTLMDTATGEPCYEGYVTSEECFSTEIVPIDGGFAQITSGGSTGVRLFMDYNDADYPDFTCTSLVVNYLQINAGIIGTPDSGTLVIPDVLAFSGTSIIWSVSPNLSYPAYIGSAVTGSGRARYSITVENCCGAIFSGENEYP
jgi:hypothetical protein